MFLFSPKTRYDADVCTTEPGKDLVDPESEETIS